MKAPLLTLNDGNLRPAVGIGTYQIRGGEGLSQLQAAIADGYRLIALVSHVQNFISPQNYQENTMAMMMP